ncbi:MAG: DUF992 domain-containing protein [Hyphomicrobiales bacterium]
MRKLKSTLKALAIVALAQTPLSAGAADFGGPADEGTTGVKVGLLTCDISGGWGLIIASNKAVDCVFKPTNYRWRDHYVGSINKIGADIGVTAGGKLVWAVFAPGTVRRGALAGSYFGASGEATVGIGLGANALLGGFGDTINLQPLSVQGQTGLNVAGGIAGLFLESQ